MSTPLTIEMVATIMPNARANGLDAEWEHCLKTLRDYEINTKNRMAAFFMNIAKESGELYYTEEIADGSDYEWRADLGNVYAGDGTRYKGHGYIQTTGRANHRLVGEALGVDAEGEPLILTKMPYPWLSAGWYWRHGSSWGNLNEYADSGDFKSTIMGVRGGPDEEREHYWWKAMRALPNDVVLPGKDNGGGGMPTGQDIVASARKLLGVWYEWWSEGESIPLWWYEYGDNPPPRSYFDANGTMCSDLVNFALNDNGLPSIGGTPAFYDALYDSGSWFDASASAVPGAVCINPGTWRGGNGQGHIAIYTDEHTLIQATDGAGSFAGVNEGEQDYNSVAWADYWLYGLLPGVDYSEHTDTKPPPIEAVTKPRWLAIGKNGAAIVNGKDFSGGWHEYKDGVLIPTWRGPNEA